MSKVEKVHQGIEVEGIIRTKTFIKALQEKRSGTEAPATGFPSRVITQLTSKDKNKLLWKRAHYDTANCTEIDLQHRDSLKGFSEIMKDVLGEVYELCRDRRWVYLLQGYTPIGGIIGCHIHHSTTPKTTPSEMKDRMTVYNPLLALLSCNSPFVYEPNARRGLRGFCTTNHIDGRLSETSLGGTLSRHTNTLEVRTPNAGAYHQLMTIATFTKACMFNENIIKPKSDSRGNGSLRSSIRSNQENTVRALQSAYYKAREPTVDLKTATNRIYLKLPKRIELFGSKVRKFIPVYPNTLFKLVVGSESFKDGLKKALAELSVRDKRNVLAAFKLVGDGWTFTDFYVKLLRNGTRSKVEGSDKANDKLIDRCNTIHDIGEKALMKDVPIWDLSKTSTPRITLKTIAHCIRKNYIRKDQGAGKESYGSEFPTDTLSTDFLKITEETLSLIDKISD